jgi:hypothetical protein
MSNEGRLQMRKTSLFAVAATVIVAGIGVWAASTTTTTARVAPSTGDGIEPFRLMLTAKELPTVEFADYTFVFH